MSADPPAAPNPHPNSIMDDEENDYEAEREEILAANAELLDAFHAHLESKNLSPKTAGRHANNIAFFADHYLADYEATSLVDGYNMIAGFLGDWFIRKAMWSDEKSIRENATSFRKYYAFLRDSSIIEEGEYKALLASIKEQQDEWIDTVDRYNDPDTLAEDIWPDILGDLPPEDAGEDAGPASRQHLIIMLSGRVMRHFKLKPAEVEQIPEFDSTGHWSDCWRCEILARIKGSKDHLFLFTNPRTLYSVVIVHPDRDPVTLVNTFVQQLFLELIGHGIIPPTDFVGSFSFVRGRPGSLIGSQNEFIRCSSYLFQRPNWTPASLAASFNRTPMSAIDGFPDNTFARALADDPPFGPAADGGNIVPFPSAN